MKKAILVLSSIIAFCISSVAADNDKTIIGKWKYSESGATAIFVFTADKAIYEFYDRGKLLDRRMYGYKITKNTLQLIHAGGQTESVEFVLAGKELYIAMGKGGKLLKYLKM